MKKKIAKGLLMLDLWLTIVATTVFVTLFFMDKVLYLNGFDKLKRHFS